MHKILSSVLTALAVVLLPQWVAAQEGKRPDGPRPEMRRQQPNPEVMFKRLDANGDGVITPNEIPAGAPERLKQLLKRADRNGDKKLALTELTEAMKRLPPMGATRGGPPGPPPQRADGRPGGWPMLPPAGWGPQGGPSPRTHAWGGPNFGSKGKQPQAKGKHEAVKGPWQKSGACPLAKKGVCPLAKKTEAKAPAVKKHEAKKHEAKKHEAKKHEAKKHEARKPEARKPEAKKHEAKRPEVKVEVKVTAKKKAIEAKLAALEKEKAATIDSLQKAQQAASAKMRELNKQRAEILGSLQKE
jgi:hypothetical protein